MSLDYTPEEIQHVMASNAVADAALALLRAHAERDRRIVDARKMGMSIRAIAEAALVSPQTVLNIVNRMENHQ